MTVQLNAKCAKDLRKEREVLVLKYFFFANFAKNLCAFAVKRLYPLRLYLLIPNI